MRKAYITKKSEFKSTCQPHDIGGVDLSFKCLQLRQIVPIDVDQGRVCDHVVSIHHRGVVNEQPLLSSNSRQASNSFFYSCMEVIVEERALPTKGEEEWIRSLARLSSSWRWEG